MSQDLDAKLIEKIVEQRSQFLEEAKLRAQRILEKAEEDSQRIMEQTHKSIEGIVGSELRAVHDRIVGRAQLEGRRRLLEARMEVLGKVKSEAMEGLKYLAEGKHPEYDYSEVLMRLIGEANQAIGGEEYVIAANKRDLTYLKKNLGKVKDVLGGKKVRLSETPLEIVGGVVVMNDDGTKTMENTLERRLEAANASLQTEIAEKLGVI
jgi:vacuolar-type H+-ATPase subunit E/Vma4